MNVPKNLIEDAKTILDVGGWFKPEPRATHVVDLMPWETRAVSLNLKPLPNERFTKKTWHQVNFLSPKFALPFPDRFFDLVLCGHTVEDLIDPSALLVEMQRVGRTGFIECPSRLSEQTIGLRDRESKKPGHPHHHWIVEKQGKELFLYSKKDSRLDNPKTLVPLSWFEKSKLAGTIEFFWSGRFSFQFVNGEECFTEAAKAVQHLKIPWLVRSWDHGMRFGRRVRSRIQGKKTEEFSWWNEILEQSRPYSSIPLP